MDINQEWTPNQADQEPDIIDLMNEAAAKGYTKHVHITDGRHWDLEVLIKPDTDLDTRFKAFDCDEGQWLYVNGWLIEGIEAAS